MNAPHVALVPARAAALGARARLRRRGLSFALGVAAFAAPVGAAPSATNGSPATRRTADYPIQAVPFTSVRFTDGFWAERQAVNHDVSIPFALAQCEASKRLDNFDLAADTMRRRAAGEAHFEHQPVTAYPFDDSDVYKAIEAASYDLALSPNPELERRLDGWIRRIAAAQEPDGYLYTWRTMHPDSPAHKWIGARRWEKDPEASHELYCAGHLYEAASAHFAATGKRTLLDVALRNTELLWRDFGAGPLRIAPGHQVIEMGLAKIFRVTGDRRLIELAQRFLAARGPGGAVYNQKHLRVADQTEAVGHAVRANYMYSGMADVAALDGNAPAAAAVTRIWDDVVAHKLYVTGGVGARHKGEAYGDAYELPHEAYNETCAAAALLMWSHRMFLLTGQSRYMDVFERTAYNAFLSGVSLSGDRFFYPNPLVWDGASKFNKGYAGRAPWFGCACCPPNVVRTIAAFGGYAYAVRGASVYVNLYASSRADLRVAQTPVMLDVRTDYPWGGAIQLRITPDKPAAFALRLRLPGWAQGQPVPSDLYTYEDAASSTWKVSVNQSATEAKLENGYLTLDRTWRAGDTVELALPMPIHRVRGHPAIAATRGEVALERGPLVYCVEDPKRQLGLPTLVLAKTARIEPRARPGGPAGLTVLSVTEESGTTARQFEAIPYFTWANGTAAPMSVWFNGGE